ncbi:hypothetical protein ACIQI7_32200 [Kitasatospora sp. NPDC092039]|uniref:hypothetical protein n=1 Tax=Kitasatospora sp. NPDC092039 TaxID=3364086 RepID=UPI003829D708
MHAELDAGGQPIENVRLRRGDFHEDWPPEREHLPGWGALIEVPAVLELLDLVVAGRLNAARARWLLAHLGEQTVRHQHPHGCGIPECVDGRRCRGEFEEDRLQEVLRRDRVDAVLAAEPADSPAVHPCIACADCSACSCYDGTPGHCHACRLRHAARTRARQDVERWNADLAAGRTYARTEHRLHRWNCPTLSTVDDRLAQFEELLEATNGRADWTTLPELHSGDELRRRGTRTRRCATCGPDPL